MRIHHHSAGDSISRAQHDISSFSRHARQREDFFHSARHLPAKLFKDRFARSHHRFRLVAEKSGRPDVLFQLARRGVRERFRIWIFFIKRFADLIDIGAKTTSWRNEPPAICGKPGLGGCAEFFLPRESRQKFSRGQGSTIPNHSQILPTRAAPPGFFRRRGPSRSPRLALVPPVQSRKRNTPHARTPFCHASRPTVF